MDTTANGNGQEHDSDIAHEPITIIVNTRPQAWARKKISFEEVVALAYPGQPTTEQDTFTARYSRGNDGHGAGTLTSGQEVAVKKGMVFDVHRTTRS
ncbi:multiubiquitin domain-containing protein [Leifsonia sp. PS1209]|uniref:multiubiquitin domain-containing protein n=1 Tax=Leifsonia sp. PS1209 TaxID=2724914 RepID=UPI001442BDA0|nr:multiubiquitin domain-containing protein [Leifsonia sp. PS1209]QIZ99814.1 hypothetical protein HF024_15730 [Leifsonia sp. PS1209]